MTPHNRPCFNIHKSHLHSKSARAESTPRLGLDRPVRGNISLQPEYPLRRYSTDIIPWVSLKSVHTHLQHFNLPTSAYIDFPEISRRYRQDSHVIAKPCTIPDALVILVSNKCRVVVHCVFSFSEIMTPLSDVMCAVITPKITFRSQARVIVVHFLKRVAAKREDVRLTAERSIRRICYCSIQHAFVPS